MLGWMGSVRGGVGGVWAPSFCIFGSGDRWRQHRNEPVCEEIVSGGPTKPTYKSIKVGA